MNSVTFFLSLQKHTFFQKLYRFFKKISIKIEIESRSDISFYTYLGASDLNQSFNIAFFFLNLANVFSI